jgi:hypothetical protein
MGDEATSAHLEGVRLIQQAYDLARASGRLEWYRMTSAVLKNRLLLLTKKSFDERAWGASSFGGFLGLFQDIVVVDDSTFPPVVELREEARPRAASGSSAVGRISQRNRVRDDLWTAVLDYSSGKRYVWDPDAQSVAVALSGADARPTLPTLTEESISEWRRAFAEAEEPGLSPREAEAIGTWRDGGLGTVALPSRLRGPWNAELKRRVVATLEQWFHDEGLGVPADLLVEQGSAESSEVERLRTFIQECVGVMTRRELEGLSLPAAAMLRLRSRKK